MKMRSAVAAFVACAIVFSVGLVRPAAAASPPPSDPLLAGFRMPPAVARPRVWWHWMNGNITKTGILKDLDWMQRVGIAGADIIDASIATPQVVPNRLVYMTPPWKDAFLFATREAAKRGMEVAIDSSPGWSETGGPWVKPDQAMKKLVWSATEIDGGRPYHGVLTTPPDNIGPFQNAPTAGDVTPSPRAAATHFYRDSIVIAYRAPVEEPRVASVTWDGGSLDVRKLVNGDFQSATTIQPARDGDDVRIVIAFARPAKIQGLSLGLTVTKGLGYAASIETSDDGKAWRAVATMPKAAQLQRLVIVQQTVSFPPARARYARIVLRPASPLPTSLRPHDPAPGLVEPAKPSPQPRTYRLYALNFRAAATVNEFEKKAQFAAPPRDFYALSSEPQFQAGSAVDPKSVIDLSARMTADGILDWNPPSGHWTVLRMGYSLTGAENHPATKEATGFEVDKLSRADVHDYIERYLDNYRSVTGSALFGRRGLQALVVDSAEAGMQNWTPDILAQFRALNGYDPTLWLPTLTGVAVRSPADSDRFLWDFRRTVAELLARNHYGEIADVARARGLSTYMEALEDHRPTFGDDIAMRRSASWPMGAMWTYGERWPSALTYEADLLGAASIAHVYGRPLVAAESLTSALQPWAFAPRDLKPLIDMEFVRGVNRIVIHTSVHQPVDKAPGLSLAGYGQFFDRLDTWAGQAKPWIDYIARSSFLLQQGRFVADVAYFYGQEAPLTSLFGDKPVDVPEGYAFDFIDSDGLENALAVSSGQLVTQSGMRYRVLYLGGSSAMMTLTVLKRIRALAEQGAVVVGRKPQGSPSLADDPKTFAGLADAVFGDGVAPFSLGKGRIFPSGSLTEAFKFLHAPPDFTYSKPASDTRLLYIHRQLDDGDLYFVSNRRDRPETVNVTFRTDDFRPELWDPVGGEIRNAASTTYAGRTLVSLNLASYGSTFVVFRKRSARGARPSAFNERAITVLPKELMWRIAFQANRGAPASVSARELALWSASADVGIRYFSGMATYTTTFDLPRGLFDASGPTEIDLGDVHDVASVTLNGKDLGTVWTPPFRVDAQGALRAAHNTLIVKVSNLWVNRLIGDAQSGARRYTFTTIPTYRPDAPLRPSGLLGPVTIRREIGG